MDSMNITKAQLDQCFLDWERDHRDGKCSDYEATKARPAEAVAREASEWMWIRLTQAGVKTAAPASA